MDNMGNESLNDKLKTRAALPSSQGRRLHWLRECPREMSVASTMSQTEYCLGTELAWGRKQCQFLVLQCCGANANPFLWVEITVQF